MLQDMIKRALGEDPQFVRLRSEVVDWREVEGEVVVLEHGSSTYFAVNESGAALWPALAQGTTVPELVTIFQERFGLEPAQAQADVETFIASLHEHHLLEPAPTEPS